MPSKPSNQRPNAPLAPPLRVCHLADIHLGFRRYNRLSNGGLNQREVDVNVAFREALDRVTRLKPDLVLIAGDLFHSVRPSNVVLTYAFRELKRLRQSIKAPIIIIAGNHESPKRVDTGCALRLLGEIPAVYISDSKTERFEFPELSAAVLCVPHVALTEESMPELRALDKYRYNILMTHLQTQEHWITDFGGVALDLRKLAPHEWDYVALGHFHCYRDLTLNASYSGSTEYTSTNVWVEAREPKGFLEVELPTGRRTFHPLTSPREVLVLPPIDGTAKEPAELTELIAAQIEAVPGGIEGKIVRLELLNVSRQTMRLVDQKRLKQLRARALHLAIEVRPTELLGAAGGLAQARRSRLDETLGAFAGAWRSQQFEGAEISKLLMEYWKRAEAEVDEGTAGPGGQNVVPLKKSASQKEAR